MNLNDHFEESKKNFQHISDYPLFRSHEISNNSNKSNLLLSRRLDFLPTIEFDLTKPMDFSLMMNPFTKASELSKLGSTQKKHEKDTPVELTDCQNLRSNFFEDQVLKNDRFQEKVKDSFQDYRRISPDLSSSQKTKTVFCSNNNVVCLSKRSEDNNIIKAKTGSISRRQVDSPSKKFREMKISIRKNLPSFHSISEGESCLMTPNSIHDCLDSSKRSYSVSLRVKVPIRVPSLDYRNSANSEISRHIFTHQVSQSFSSLNFRNRQRETKRVSPHRSSFTPLLSSLNTNNYIYETPTKHNKSKDRHLNIIAKKLHICNITSLMSNNIASFNMKSNFRDQASRLRFERNNRLSFPLSLNGATPKDFFLTENSRSANNDKLLRKKSEDNLDNRIYSEHQSNQTLINKSNDLPYDFCKRKKFGDSVSVLLSEKLQSFFTYSKQILFNFLGFNIQIKKCSDSNRYTKADPLSSNSQNSFPRSKCFTNQTQKSSCFLIPCLIFLFIMKLILPTSTNIFLELLQNTKRFFLRTLKDNYNVNFKVKRYLSQSLPKMNQKQFCCRSLNFRQNSIDEIQTSFSTKN